MSTRQTFAGGAALFAGVMLFTLGAIQVLQSLVALFTNEIYVQGPEYVYEFDLTVWGIIHLVIGIAVAIVGLFILAGAAWARMTGIILGILVILANFMFLPYYPVGSIVVIGMAVVAIWGLITADQRR